MNSRNTGARRRASRRAWLRLVAFAVVLAGRLTHPALGDEGGTGPADAWSADRETQLLEELAKGLGVESYQDHVQALIKELKRRDETYSRPPEPVEDLMFSLIRNAYAYADKLKELQTFHGAAVTKLGKDDLRPFDELRHRHEELGKKAARNGAILPPEIAAKVRSRTASKGEKKYFGKPESALTFDPQLIAKIKVYNQEQNEILFAWEAEASKYQQQGRQFVEETNKALEARYYPALVPLLRNHHGSRKEIDSLFYSRKYEHCLGVPKQSLVMHSYEQERGAFGEADQRGATLAEIPGMRIELYALDTIRKKLPPLPPPKAPGQPAEFLFYKDGPQTLQRWAEKEEYRLEGARYEYLAEAIEGPRYVCETAKNFGVGLVEGVYKPLENLADSEQTWSEAFYNTGKELTYDNAMGVLKTGCDLVEDIYNVTKEAHDDVVNNLEKACSSPEGAAEVLEKCLKSSLDEMTGRYDDMLRMQPLFEPSRPSEGASAEEWRKYGERVGERADQVEEASDKLRERTDWYKKHVVDNSVRALTLYMAGKGGAASLRSVKGLCTKSWEKVKGARVDGDVALRKTQLANQVLDRHKSGGKVSKDVLDLAEQSKSYRQAFDQRAKGAELDAKISQIEEAAQRNLAMEAQQRNWRPMDKPFEAQGQPLQLRDGRTIPKGQSLGEGTFKKVYEHQSPDRVVQVIDDPKSAAKVYKREKISTENIDKAGVERLQVFEEVATADGKVVRVVERVDPASMAKNVLKKQDGKFTPEQEAALADCLDKLNDNNMVWTDPNPGNFCFALDNTGRVVVKITDMDNVVSLDAVVRRGQTKIDLAGDRAYDLTNPTHVKDLQRFIAYGNKMVREGAEIVEQGYALEIGETLATPEYTGGSPVPGTVGRLGNGLSKNFMSMSPKQARAALNTGRQARMQQALAGNDNYKQLVWEREGAASLAEQQVGALEGALAKLDNQDAQWALGTLPKKGKGAQEGRQMAVELELLEDEEEEAQPVVETLAPVDFRQIESGSALDTDFVF